MADKTFGVKVTEELHDKVKDMVEAAGITTKDWFEKAVALTEIQNLKEGASEYKQDLSELEVHTTRIYDLVSNMIKRANFLKDAAVNNVAVELLEKETQLKETRENLNQAKEHLAAAGSAFDLISKEKEEIVKQLEEIRFMNENNQSLIAEYKEKIDTLSGLVSQYQSFQKENDVLKHQIEEKRSLYQSQFDELKMDLKSLDDLLNDSYRNFEDAEKKHSMELERLAEKKDFEREKSLLEVERKFQQKYLSLSEEYNVQIKKLYEEKEAARKEFEDKLLSLQQVKKNKVNNKTQENQ